MADARKKLKLPHDTPCAWGLPREFCSAEAPRAIHEDEENYCPFFSFEMQCQGKCSGYERAYL